MKAILNDVTRCTGCEQCVQACVEANGLGEELPAVRARPDGLSASRFCSVVVVSGAAYARKSCLHCLQPACAEACLVGALRKTPAGPVIYDPDKCIGCRYCMLACPLAIPRYQWERTLPFVRKCTMCAERIAGGRLPACVEACPHDAMLFGDRDALLAEARRRIRSQPDRYLPHIYGQDELGGTCVLYISHVPLDVLGWPAAIGERPLPAYTWPVISKTPVIAVTVAASLSAITWIIRRRMRIAEQEAQLGPAGPASGDHTQQEQDA